MLKENFFRKKIEIPEKVNITLSGKKINISGIQGSIERDFTYSNLNIKHDGNSIVVEVESPDKKKIAMVGTISSHIKNMIYGVMDGFIYKLKIVFSHFPMNVNIKNNEVIIENFYGERRPRKAKIQGHVKVEVKGEDIIVEGVDLEDVSQTAINIQKATIIKKKDPRIFLDGIYIFEKGRGVGS